MYVSFTKHGRVWSGTWGTKCLAGTVDLWKSMWRSNQATTWNLSNQLILTTWRGEAHRTPRSHNFLTAARLFPTGTIGTHLHPFPFVRPLLTERIFFETVLFGLGRVFLRHPLPPLLPHLPFPSKRRKCFPLYLSLSFSLPSVHLKPPKKLLKLPFLIIIYPTEILTLRVVLYIYAVAGFMLNPSIKVP